VNAALIESIAEPTSVRFFTSASLRPHEEVPGEVVEWLPRAITVEFAGDRPVAGVWRSIKGERRVCWYSNEVSDQLRSSHAERYGDEAFWVIDRAGLGERRLRIFECDENGLVHGVRVWEFDALDMPRREEERAADGSARVVRTYECVSDGVVCEKTEALPGQSAIVLPRPHRFPAAELAGEPFPCGRHLRGVSSADGARLLESIQHNDHQAIAFAAYRRAGEWRRGVVTIAAGKGGWNAETRRLMELDGPGLAPLILTGRLEGKLPPRYPLFGVLEGIPDGQPMEELVAARLVTVDDAIAIALEVGHVAKRAHEQGVQLGTIRPDLVYARRVDDRLALTQIMDRGPAVIEQTYAGESVLWPPVPAADWSSDGDVRGLAQLVWYGATGTHPFLAPDDVRWDPSWNELRHSRRRRQPWTGSASLGALLERVLFESGDSTSLEAFLGELAQLR
jgi:hypothetical protein